MTQNTSALALSDSKTPFETLFSSLLQDYDVSTVESKIDFLSELCRAIESFDNNAENNLNVSTWGSITCAIAGTASLIIAPILIPVAGTLVSVLAGSSAIVAIGSAVLNHQVESGVIEKIKRYKLALESTQLVDWAVMWHCTSTDSFVKSLYSASRGEIFNNKLIRNKPSLNASLDYLASISRKTPQEFIAMLSTVKAGGSVAPLPANTAQTVPVSTQTIQESLPQSASSDLYGNAVLIRNSLVNRAADSVLGGCVILAALGAGKTTFLGTAWGRLKDKHGTKFKSLSVVVKKSDVEAFRGISDKCLSVKNGAVTAAVAIIKFIDASTNHSGNISRLFLDDFLTMIKFFETGLKGKLIDPATYAVYESKKEASESQAYDAVFVHEYLLTLLNEYWLVGREYNSAVWVSSHSSNVQDLPFMGSASARSVGDMIFLAKNGKREFIELALGNSFLISDNKKRQELKTQLDTIDVQGDEPIVLGNFNNWTLGIVSQEISEEYKAYRKVWESSPVATSEIQDEPREIIRDAPPKFTPPASTKRFAQELDLEEDDEENIQIETIEDVNHVRRFLETLTDKEPLTVEAQKIYTKLIKVGKPMTIRELAQSTVLGKKGNNGAASLRYYLDELVIANLVTESNGSYSIS